MLGVWMSFVLTEFIVFIVSLAVLRQKKIKYRKRAQSTGAQTLNDGVDYID